MQKNTKDTVTPSGRKLLLQLAALKTKPFVKIGILARDYEKPKETEDGSTPKTTLGVVAASNEFGAGKIPARSYIGSTVDAKGKGDWARNAEVLRKQIIEGKLTTDQALARQGERILTDIREKVRSDIPPENAPATIAKKQRGKAGPVKTLIDTSQLLNGLAYEVKREGMNR